MITKETEEQGTGMKLVLAVASEPGSRAIQDALVAAQYRVTLISTTGGFLRKGNATLLLGVESGQVDDVLKQIQIACIHLPRPDPAESCATVFVLDVGQHLRT